jgi:hypothetical protein
LAYTHTWGLTFRSGGQSVSSTTETVTASGEANISETIPLDSEDFVINMAIDISVLKSIFMLASKDMTLYTNDDHDGTPAHTIELKAGQALRWTVNSAEASPFAADPADVTDVRVTNVGAAGTLQIWTLQDATP